MNQLKRIKKLAKLNIYYHSRTDGYSIRKSIGRKRGENCYSAELICSLEEFRNEIYETDLSSPCKSWVSYDQRYSEYCDLLDQQAEENISLTDLQTYNKTIDMVKELWVRMNEQIDDEN